LVTITDGNFFPFFSIILEEIFKAGNIDRKLLPNDFYQLPAIDQVSFKH
jgi:hypothetical protein